MASSAPLARVNLINFVRTMAVTSALFLLPLYFVDIGFSGVQIGLIVSLCSLSPLLAAFPTGWVNDRFSVGGVVRTGLLVVGFVFLALAMTGTFAAVAILFFLLGAASNALDVSLNSFYYKDETAIDQNRKYGRFVFWTGAGPVLGIVGGGLLLRVTGFRVLLFAFSALAIAVVPVVRHLGAGRFHVVALRDYGRDFFRRKSLLFVVFVFVMSMHWAVEGTVYGPFLRQRFGLDNLQASLYIAAGLAFLPLGALLIGRKRFNLRANTRLLLAFMAVSGAGLMLMTVGNVAVSLLFRFAHDFADGAMGALIALTTSRLFDKKSIGGSAGLLLAIMILAKVLGAMVFSPLGFEHGLRYPFIVAGALILADALFGVFIFRRLEY